jgi:hypothetical protein
MSKRPDGRYRCPSCDGEMEPVVWYHGNTQGMERVTVGMEPVEAWCCTECKRCFRRAPRGVQPPEQP